MEGQSTPFRIALFLYYLHGMEEDWVSHTCLASSPLILCLDAAASIHLTLTAGVQRIVPLRSNPKVGTTTTFMVIYILWKSPFLEKFCVKIVASIHLTLTAGVQRTPILPLLSNPKVGTTTYQTFMVIYILCKILPFLDYFWVKIS